MSSTYQRQQSSRDSRECHFRKLCSLAVCFVLWQAFEVSSESAENLDRRETWFKVDAGEQGQLGLVLQMPSYDSYVKAQAHSNRQKLHDQWVPPEVIEMLARWLRENVVFKEYFGICHGTRSGREQQWFREALGWVNGSVIGTEISDTAESFPNTVRLDFHEVREEWIGKADFIYSNSLDHSFDPRRALRQWMRCLSHRGVLLLEHCSGHTMLGARRRAGEFADDDGFIFEADVFAAGFSEYLRLVMSIPGTEIADVLRAPGKHWHESGCRYIVAVRAESGLEVVQPFADARLGPRLLPV